MCAKKADKRPPPVDSLKHKDKRKNIPTEELRDFVAEDGPSSDDLLNLLIEVTGENKKNKAAKVATARTLWVPAVNNHGGFGRWDFAEITDPWNAESTIRATTTPSGRKG